MKVKGGEISSYSKYLPTVFTGKGSGTTYLAGTVCFVLKGPYVALMEIGCELWNTVNLSVDSSAAELVLKKGASVAIC